MAKASLGLAVAISLLLTLWSRCQAKQQYALNVPRILLPLVPSSGIKSNFTITSTYGCFIWTSTKPDVASVEPILELNGKGGCSTKAVVTAQSTQVVRLSSVIMAEEAGGGIVLRCDVFVDTISRIEITTRTRELLLEEEPERFQLQAFDEEGNMFSTLDGQILDWILLPDEEATHQQAEPEEILKFILFEESTYSIQLAIRRLEAEGLQGDTVLVAGVSTGSAKVEASLVDKTWKDVGSAMVKLLVIENLMLQPCMDVYILPLSFVDYRVERRKHGRVEAVPVPSDQHSLQLTNYTVAELDTQISRVTGLILGFTEVVLQDKNMLHMPTATKPSAGVHVVAAHHLSFSILPDNIWVLEVGQEYHISVHIYDKANHKILPTGNIPLSTTLPLDHLTVHFSSVNESYHHVTAEKVGSAYLHSSLSHLKHPVTGELFNLSNTISRKQLVEIYDPIQVEPKQLVLLWDPQSGYRYRHLLKATGGSGTYVWSCDPEGVVSVAGNGSVQTVAKGSAVVFAADVKNTAHCNQTEVHVVPPSKMAFLPAPVEVRLGKTLSLPLQILGYVDKDKSKLLPFADCRQLNIAVTLSEPSIFNVSIERGDIAAVPEGACLVLSALALTQGFTRVTVSYTYGRSIYMEAVVTIAAYPPLVAVDPAEGIGVVSLGASMEFVFEGGPMPWVLDRSKFSNTMTAEDTSKVSVEKQNPIRDVYQHVYRVLCLQLGEQELSVAVGNGPTNKNQFPAREEATTRISCAIPVSMTIHPVLSHMPDCPLYTEDSTQIIQFPVLCGEDLNLEVRMLDSENRPFDNFTSLHLLWESSDDELLPLPSPLIVDHRRSRAVLRVHVGEQSGSVKIKVTCTKHIQSYLQENAISFQDPFSPGVVLSVTLLLRNRPSPSPPSLLLYNHPDNHATITILHGSRHFLVNPTSKTYPPAEVHYTPETQTISVVPFSEGKMKISIQDLCLDPGGVVIVGVAVGSVYKIEVVMADKVQVKNSTLACVQVLDFDDEPFLVSQLRYMNLQPYPKTSHISVSPTSQRNLATSLDEEEAYNMCYVVEGVLVGSTYLLFNATASDGQVISSRPKEIQVFAPLKLTPETITLLPTAIFQVHSSGGPKPQISILYSISDDKVADISDSGMIYAKEVGTAVVTGRLILGETSFGQPASYSQDTVNIRVVKLMGIKIFIPTPRLLSGVDIATYAQGLAGESPFSFASCTPGLTFQWSVSNMDTLSLTSVYDKAGVSLQEEQDFDVSLHARNPGQGVVRLVVKCPPGLCIPDNAVFTDQVQVVVIPPLQLLRPLSGHFLLPHNGVARIMTNRDGITQLNFQLLQGPNGEKSHIVSVDGQGEVKAAAVSGHAVVMVTESEEVYRLNQTLIVHVEVHPVASLSIMPLSLAQATPNSKLHAFPLGYSAQFLARLHDNVGRQFDYAEVPLSHRLNRYDTVLVTPESGNTTYTIKAAKQGDAVLRVWLSSQPRVKDYIRIRVGYAILPSLATIHLGSPVCFSTHLTEDKPGWWSVGEEGVMFLSPDSGVGRAMGVGRTVVYHKIEDTTDTHTEITVAKVERAEFNVTRELLTPFTNGHRQEGVEDYLLPIQFFLGGDETFTPIHTSPNMECLKITMGMETPPPRARFYYIQQVPFECHVELRDHSGVDVIATKYIGAQATFDPYTSKSYCKLLRVESPTSAESLSTRNGLRLTLTVVAFDLSQSYSVMSDPLPVPFEPGFHVSRREVIMSVIDSITEVTLTGLLHQLQAIKVSSPYPLSITHSSSPSHTKATYRLSLLPDYHCPPEPPFTSLNISFLCTLTNQEEQVTVSFLELDAMPTTLLPTSTPLGAGSKGRGASSPSIPAYFPYIVITILAVLLATIVICMALNKSTANSNSGFQHHLPANDTSMHPAFSPSAASPLTSPQHLQGSSSFHQTPSTFPHHQRVTPSVSMSGAPHGSAYKRTNLSSSPGQHGLFSQ